MSSRWRRRGGGIAHRLGEGPAPAPAVGQPALEQLLGPVLAHPRGQGRQHLLGRIDAATERLDEILERAKGVCYVSNTLARGPELIVRRVDPRPG